jgi:CheY-like chemotaxis protein
MMPNMTGIDFYEALLLRQPAIAARIIFLTGAATTLRAADFLATVANTRIEKPFDVRSLRAMIQKALGGSELSSRKAESQLPVTTI